MSTPQIENGYFKMSTELFDAICKIRIPGEARQCFDFIMRKTYGWHKKSDKISLSQFEEFLSMKRSSVCRNIKFLEKNKLILVKKNGYLGTDYSINKNFSQWQIVSKKRLPTGSLNFVKSSLKNETRGSLNFDNRVVSKMRHTIDTITKDITKDTNTKDTPPFANAPAEPKKPVNNIQVQFVNDWASLYETETGEKFKADRKDYVIIARLIKDHGLDQVTKKSKILFNACKKKNLWFTKGGIADFNISKLSARWNELIESNNGGNNHVTKFEQTASAIREYARKNGIV